MLNTATRFRHLARTLPIRFTTQYSTAKPKPTQMPVSPPSAERSAELVDNYNQILNEVKDAAVTHPGKFKPRLVAVSKLKPAEDIQALYDAGVRHFGENYPQELCEKAAQLPSDIAWHFIGALQSNKAKSLASIPNLYALETLTSAKSASLLAKTVAALSPPRPDRLNVFLQLNTSNEESKSGLPPTLAPTQDGQPSELLALAVHVLSTCPELRLKGLMTIGSFDASHGEGEENPDFATLARCGEELVAALRKEVEGGKEEIKAGLEEIEKEGLELSMGMSDDFVKAIKQGSSNVRVGSRIFGARPPRKP